MDRRRFLKYAGATAAVVGASAVGLEYLAKPKSATLNQTATTSSISMLPRITSLTYEPSKVVNSKIYDIRVDVEISNPARRLSSVEATLQPVSYVHLPSEAFPSEEPRVNTLQPTGLEKELLSTSFRNLKGGREYDVKAVASGPSSTIDERTLRTQYVREFENIAPLDDVTVIADYYMWYGGPPSYASWHDYETGKPRHTYMPLLAEYDSGDPIVISRHIDWATGHGIDAFSISWHTTGQDEQTHAYFEMDNIRRLLSSPLLGDIKFCILYEDGTRLPKRMMTYEYDSIHGTELTPIDNDENRARLLSDFIFLSKNFFRHENYLKVGGRPFVQFDADRTWTGKIGETLALLRTQTKELGFDPYLCGNMLGWYFPNAPYDSLEPRNRDLVASMDAISASGNMWLFDREKARADFPAFTDDLYRDWYEFAIRYNPTVDLIPNIMPGEEVYPTLQVPSWHPLTRSPALLGKLVDVAMKYTGKLRRIWKVTSFNEWMAGIEVEPSSDDHGLDYLNVLRTSLESLGHA